MTIESLIEEARCFAADGNISRALYWEKRAASLADRTKVPRPALSVLERQDMYKKGAEINFTKAQRAATEGDVYWALRLEKQAGEAAELSNISRPMLSPPERQTMYKKYVEKKFSEVQDAATTGNSPWVLHLIKKIREASNLATIPCPTLSHEEQKTMYTLEAEARMRDSKWAATEGDLSMALLFEKKARDAAHVAGIPQPTLSTEERQAMYQLFVDSKFREAQRLASEGHVLWALDAEKEAGEIAKLADISSPVLSYEERENMYEKGESFKIRVSRHG